MTKMRHTQERPPPKQRDGTSTASAILAAVSLLGISLGVTEVAAAENVGSAAGIGETAASHLKLAQAGQTKQNVLQSNQYKRPASQNVQVKPQVTQSKVKSQDVQSNRSKLQLQSGRGKGCKRYHC